MTTHISLTELVDRLGPRLALVGLGVAAPLLILDGRLRLDQPLAHGARGLVCKAYHLRLKQPVAVKLFPLGPDVTREVEAEAQALAQLRGHPNIVDVYDVDHTVLDLDGESIECLVLTMEYIAGMTLRTWLQAGRKRKEILQTFLAAGAGLVAAHAKGISHRDFKPENVMIGNDKVPRVVDFGLARAPRTDAAAAPGEPYQTRFGPFAGTIEYIAPEARKGNTGERSDQYAFAVALWHALTGVFPYNAHNGEWRLASDPDFYSADALPRRLARPLRKALAHPPDDRYSSMAEFLGALHRAAAPRKQLAVAAAVLVLTGLAFAWRGNTLPTEPEPEPPAVPKPVSPFVREAFIAYLSTLRAYNRRDADAYYGGFASPMDCFYSAREADIRQRRKKLAGYLEVSERDLVLVDTDEATMVTFCDRGLFDYEHGKGRIAHNKAILMRKVSGEWKVAVETTSKHTTCFESPCNPPPG